MVATSFIISDERKGRVKVVVGGESSCHVDGSGAAPDVGVPFIGQFIPDLPILHEVVVGEEARRQVEDEGTEADDESETVSVGRPLSIVEGASQRASPLRGQLRELVSFQRQTLLWPQTVYRYVSFQTSE